jgi:hypothetical protein
VSELLIALAGIGTGALATGAVQVLQTRMARRLRTRVAARLLTGELHLATQAIDAIADAGRWPDNNEADFTALFGTWHAQREAFAAGASALDWEDVAVACRHLADVPGARPPGEPLTAHDHELLDALTIRIRRASDATGMRSHKWRERNRFMKTHAKRKLDARSQPGG